MAARIDILRNFAMRKVCYLDICMYDTYIKSARSIDAAYIMAANGDLHLMCRFGRRG